MRRNLGISRPFATHWLDFLIQWKGVYSKIDQAAKETPQERQWFGRVNAERRSDELLKYLFEARNDGEHGLNSSVDHGIPEYHLAPKEDITITKTLYDNEGRLHFFDEKGREIESVKYIQAKSSLKEVHEWDGKKKVQAPKEHLGQPMEPHPMVAAELGLKWIRELVAIATAMSEP